ncbi:hypothetical protein BDY24DRAFT_376345 [Mrakia frigida]|uniref:DUF202 domain-containing protein n=1 Tax=Mrakia frigida TaxID=29902 RepID=UPI003FCBF005
MAPPIEQATADQPVTSGQQLQKRSSGLKEWWISSGLAALELENTGSVARDHLASERTYLAWLRTSLAFCSVGVALTQLFSLTSPLALDPIPSPPSTTTDPTVQAQLEAMQLVYRDILTVLSKSEGNRRFARPLGGLLIGLGFIILLIGIVRYFTVQSHLIANHFPATRLPIMGISLLTGAVVIVVLGVVVGM